MVLIMLLDNVQELCKIGSVNTFEKVFELNDFVFSLIPHNIMKEPLDINKSWYEYYDLFKKKEFFGWCYTNALYLLVILKQFGVDSYLYNYGIREKKFTHVVTIVTIKNTQYLFDPYFNRYYTDENDNILSFSELLVKIKCVPKNIKSVYGNSTKPVFQEGRGDFIDFTPQRLEESVINSWKVCLGFDQDPLLLLLRKIQRVSVLTDSHGAYYYNFF